MTKLEKKKNGLYLKRSNKTLQIFKVTKLKILKFNFGYKQVSAYLKQPCRRRSSSSPQTCPPEHPCTGPS